MAPNLVESITDYFTEDTGPKSKDFGAVDVKGEGVLDISKIKGVIPADEYYKDLGGFNDIVTRNVIVDQNRRYADIFTGRTKEDRLDRQALRYQAS